MGKQKDKPADAKEKPRGSTKSKKAAEAKPSEARADEVGKGHAAAQDPKHTNAKKAEPGHEPNHRGTRADAMQLTRATRVAFTALLIMNLASAAAAIGLLGRMRPAIERIIERNIYSLEAVEDMLVVLAQPEGPTDANRRTLEEALQRAERNITADQERPLIAVLRSRSAPALAGDLAARRESLKALQELAAVNRRDIEQSDQSAKRLGTAGAWAVSFLALLGLGSGLIGLRRFDRRVLAPLEELHSVLADHSSGQRLRRCGALGHASKELHASMVSLNQLLDSRAEESVRRIAVTRREGAEEERQTLLAALDLIPQPTWLVDSGGAILAANSSALDQVARDPALARAVRAVAEGESATAEAGIWKRIERTTVEGGDRALLQLGSEIPQST